MEFEQAFNELAVKDGTWGVVIQVFLVVFVSLLFDFIQKRIVSKLEARAETTESPWDTAILFAIKRPLSMLIWLVGIAFAADIVGRQTDAAIFAAINPIRDVGMIAIIAWTFMRMVSAVEQSMLANPSKHYDPTTLDAISKLLRISVVITGLLMALQTLGFSISGVLAFGGIGGIAVGFAAKDLLANFFGGLMIYLDRPFAVGEWIRSPDRTIEGTVEQIGWRLTRIRTFDKRPLYVPNSTFASISVENPSRMSHRRIYETIGIRYDDAAKMGDIVAEVKGMLWEHPEIDANQTLIVNFNSFAPSSLDFFVYTFTKTTEWVKYHEVKQDVLLKVIEIIENNGAQIAFPTSTVHVPNGVNVHGEGVPASES